MSLSLVKVASIKIESVNKSNIQLNLLKLTTDLIEANRSRF
jgi:hypothetical protein